MNKRMREIIIEDLCVVPESIQDAQDIYTYMGCDEEITKYTGWNPYSTLQAAMEKIQSDLNQEELTYSWVIKKEDTFIGTIGAYDYHSEDLSIEIGYSIARPYWAKGYAKKVVKAVVSYLEKEASIQKIRAWSHIENSASIKVLKSAGFQQVATKENQIIFEFECETNA